MKKTLPENAKIAKEAKECVQECVSEFISFITSEASDRCQQEKRKTINGEDILWAMQSLGFENYAEALKIYLSKFREVKPIWTRPSDVFATDFCWYKFCRRLSSLRPQKLKGPQRLEEKKRRRSIHHSRHHNSMVLYTFSPTNKVYHNRKERLVAHSHNTTMALDSC